MNEKRLNASVKPGLVILSALYAVTIFAEFIAPYDYREQTRQEPSCLATALHFVDADGSFHLRPLIQKTRLTNVATHEYTEDTSRAYPIRLFVRGSSYTLLGLIG